MAEGRCTGAFSLTEPGYGSDAANLETTAARDGAGYVLNGVKRYITNAADADMFLVMARTGGPGAGGVSAFAVDAGTPGIRAGAPVAMMGHRGSRVSEVYLEDCRVPEDALVGGREGLGLKAALRGINHARTHVAATCVGQAKRLTAEAVRYAPRTPPVRQGHRRTPARPGDARRHARGDLRRRGDGAGLRPAFRAAPAALRGHRLRQVFRLRDGDASSATTNSASTSPRP